MRGSSVTCQFELPFASVEKHLSGNAAHDRPYREDTQQDKFECFFCSILIVYPFCKILDGGRQTGFVWLGSDGIWNVTYANVKGISIPLIFVPYDMISVFKCMTEPVATFEYVSATPKMPALFSLTWEFAVQPDEARKQLTSSSSFNPML